MTPKLSRQFAASGFPGFCVSVVKGDKVVYQHGFGDADVRSRKPYTVRTIQPIGSVSKTFIGVALMKAVEMGCFSLDTPVDDVLGFRVANPCYPNVPITIRQLATHTSGILDREAVYKKTYLFGRSAPTTSLRAFLTSYLTVTGPLYSRQNFARDTPGASFHYSNIGATLAAYAIEVKAGMPYAEFVQRYVLQPLHMHDSGWLRRAGNAAHAATLYNPQRAPYPVYSSVTYPDGGLRSSCADLSRYLMGIIKGYHGQPSRPLTSRSFRTMLSPQFSSRNRPTGVTAREPNQGIFFAFRRDGSIGHTGSDYGVSAFLFFSPKTNVGKVFLTNIDIQENPKLATQFARIWRTMDILERRHNPAHRPRPRRV